jgi:hypothetical protein
VDVRRVRPAVCIFAMVVGDLDCTHHPVPSGWTFLGPSLISSFPPISLLRASRLAMVLLCTRADATQAAGATPRVAGATPRVAVTTQVWALVGA